MPHGRDSSKKLIGAWLTPEEINAINRVCIRLQCTRSELIRRVAELELPPKTRKPTTLHEKVN